MINLLKKFVFRFRNTKDRRDKTGKIIDDRARRKHIKETKAKITSGEIRLPPKVDGKPRRYLVLTKNTITLRGGIK